jgi:hypothetical protein
VIACAPTPFPPTNAAATDLRFVAETVRQTHPALNGGPSRQAFDLLARALEAVTSESSSPAEVYALTARLLSSLHDGHTLIVPVRTEINLPLSVRWIVDGMVVTQASATSGITAGDKVIWIVTEVLMTREISWLQPACAGLGIAWRNAAPQMLCRLLAAPCLHKIQTDGPEHHDHNDRSIHNVAEDRRDYRRHKQHCHERLQQVCKQLH